MFRTLRQHTVRRGQRALDRLFESLAGPPSAASRPRADGGPDVVVDCAVYAEGGRRSGRVHFADAARQVRRRPGAFVWLGLHEPDRATMRAIGDAFELHDLTTEQAVTGGHRPVVETIGGVTRIVLRTARYVEHEELTETSEVVDTGDVTILLGERFVVTVRHGAPGALWKGRENREQRPPLLSEGAWAVA